MVLPWMDTGSYRRGEGAGHLGQRNKSSPVVSISLGVWPVGGNAVFSTDGLHAPRCLLLTQVPSLSPCYPPLTHQSNGPTDRVKSWHAPNCPRHSVQLGKLLHNSLCWIHSEMSVIQMYALTIKRQQCRTFETMCKTWLESCMSNFFLI